MFLTELDPAVMFNFYDVQFVSLMEIVANQSRAQMFKPILPLLADEFKRREFKNSYHFVRVLRAYEKI